MEDGKKEADKSCPNCGTKVEDAEHLNRCSDEGRTNLWNHGINSLSEWLSDLFTHPELREWIPEYLWERGRKMFSELGEMTPHMCTLAAAQDQIGWRHFTEGKIALPIRRLQEFYLLHCPTQLTVDAWMQGLIDQLFQMTHSQWIYRNITKHHHTNGTIQLKARREVLNKVERQLNLGFTSLPPESRCLLEIAPADLYNSSTEKQQY